MRRLTAIGDSITHGSAPAAEPLSLVEENYIKLFSKHFGFDSVENFGTNGTTICPITDWRPTCAMCRYIDEMRPADVLIIAGGTNDYGKDVEIGCIDDKTEETFYGALDILYTKAVKKYGKIIVITPIPRHNENTKNKKGYILADYRKAIINRAKQYDLFVIHGENLDFDVENDEFREKHIKDGLHPNTLGHKIYADYVISTIENANFLEKKKIAEKEIKYNRLAALGASNVHGSAFDEPYNVAKTNFVDLLGEYFGCAEIHNYGVNGTTACPKTDWRPTLALSCYVDETYPADIAIVSAGSNDYVKDVEVGSLDDTTDETFCGSMNIFFNKAKRRFDRIIVLTSIPRKNQNIPNKKGYILNDYRKALSALAEKHGLIVVKGENAPIYIEDEQFCKKYMSDAVHVNSQGHKILFDYIVTEIEKASI